jgi:hypothetical protein
MSKTSKWFVCLAAALMLMASVAQAKTVNVTCGSDTISNALKTLDPSQSNLIRVSGVCDEFVTITDFVQLSIVGTANGSGITGSNAAPLLWIVRSHVQISNLTLNGGLGVTCRDFSFCTFSGNNFENGTGVQLDNADATFSGDVIQGNTNAGLLMTASRARVANVKVINTVAGSQNPGDGIIMQNGSSLTVEGLTVDGNAGTGVKLISFSSLQIRPWAGEFSVTNNLSGGIWVTGNSSAVLGGVVVTGNQVGPDGNGAGIVITGNSSAQFWGRSTTVTGNQPIDMYCSVNGLATTLRHVTVGSTNCVDPYQ